VQTRTLCVAVVGVLGSGVAGVLATGRRMGRRTAQGRKSTSAPIPEARIVTVRLIQIRICTQHGEP